MDITLCYYYHPVHWPYFWELYDAYQREVNGENFSVMTNKEKDGIIYQTTFLEQKVLTISQDTTLKVLMVRGEPTISAFIHIDYPQTPSESGATVLPHVEGMYIAAGWRGKGLANYLLRSMGIGTHFTFETNKNIVPHRLLEGEKLAKLEEKKDTILWKAEVI